MSSHANATRSAGLSAAEASRTRRRALVTAVLSVLVVVLFIVRVTLGDFTITIPDVIQLIMGHDVGVPGAEYILMESKLPRAVAALVGGALFGAAGAAMQSLVRNPLASPDVLGLSLGSSTAAIFAITVLGWSGILIPVVAVLGGLAVAGVILGLSRGQVSRMILVGIAMAAALQSLIQWILLKSSAFQAQDAMVWLSGSLSAVTWTQITQMSVVGLPVLALLATQAHRLRVLEVGRPLATGLGVPVRLTEALVFLCVVLSVAMATSACGPIAFIALLAGPIARRLVGRTSIVPAALVGAVITLAGDYIGAYLIPGGSLPVGVVTGLAGAPVLAWLLISSSRGPRTATSGSRGLRERLAALRPMKGQVS